MSNDKLRDLTPVDVEYAPGERPTDEKLEGAEVQTKSGLTYLENTMGDAFGESLSSDLMWISNISRDIGDRSALNPVLKPSISLTSYIQNLTAGENEHEVDLIPVGIGSSIISSSADVSVTPGQYKNTVAELEIPGDWTILGGLSEGGVTKNSRRLITHTPSGGGTVTFAEMTSGRGSAYEGARNNTIPNIGQAEASGAFLAVSLSDAINNIYTIQLPVEDTVKDSLYNNTTASLSNTESAVGSGQQLKLPSWMFDAAGLDMGSDAGGGGPKTFPLNSIRIYDYITKKVLDGLLEVKASTTAGNREWEIACTFRSDIILDTGAGQYVLVTSGTSLSEMVGALAREVFFHNHAGDDMIRGVKHSNTYGLRTGDLVTSERTAYYGPSGIHNNDHSMYLHRNGYTATDLGAGGNVMRGHIVVGNSDTGSEPSHENFNLLDDSYSITFGQLTDGGRAYFDKLRVQNLVEGRGNIPQNFNDTALVIEGSKDDTTSLLKTTYIDGNLRVGSDVVLGTDETHDVFVSGDIYIKNSMTLIPRTTAGLTPETGMSIYSSTENAPIFWNGTAWVNSNSIGYASVVGDGVTSFGKYNGATAATLQSAIADAVLQGGGKVKVLRGSYSYGATAVTIPSIISIEGEGPSTIIDATGTAFAFDALSSHSSLAGIKIQNAAKAISIDGTEHSLDELDIHSCAVGIELKAASDRSVIGSLVSFVNTPVKVDLQTTNTGNKKATTESVGYSNRIYLSDPVDKASQLDKWKRISGTGTMAFVDDTDSMIGRGRFTISGAGLFVFEDYMPVMPTAGIGGYLNIKQSGGATASIGYQAYDADLSLLTSNGGFIRQTQSLAGSYDYYQDICVQEAASGSHKFPIGTRFIRASIDVTLNGGTVSFDGFNIFPMNFSTISLYS